MDARAIDPEADGLVGFDGFRMLHPRHDLGPAEIGEQQALVAEHLGETDRRGEIGAKLGSGAVAFGDDVFRTDAQGDRGSGRGQVELARDDRHIDAPGLDGVACANGGIDEVHRWRAR